MSHTEGSDAPAVDTAGPSRASGTQPENGSPLRWMVFWTILLLALPGAVWVVLAIAKLSLLNHVPWIWVDRALWAVGGVLILAGLEVSVRVPLNKDTLVKRFGSVDRIWWWGFVALGLILVAGATALARDVGEALLNAVKQTGEARMPWGLQTLSSSLVVWATLVAYRLKPLHDALAALPPRRRPRGAFDSSQM